MNELTTDLWALLLPPEWFADQDEETIVITDSDEVSVIEISALYAEEGQDKAGLLESLLMKENFKTTLAELDAIYQEFTEDDMYWREWFIDLGDCYLAISHGCDIDNKSMDDASVDEILSTLALKIPDDE
ncbi:MAG: hypothetical protein HRU20_22515 [Pseudomonadales bacterium]|nr:hypothetical protein [Pseudomonadales bacterium]